MTSLSTAESPDDSGHPHGFCINSIPSNGEQRNKWAAVGERPIAAIAMWEFIFCPLGELDRFTPWNSSPNEQHNLLWLIYIHQLLVTMSMSEHVLTHNILYHHIPTTTLPPAHLWTKHVAPWFIFCFHDGANTQWYEMARKYHTTARCPEWPLPHLAFAVHGSCAEKKFLEFCHHLVFWYLQSRKKDATEL